MLLELPLLRLGTDVATAIEVGGDILRSAASALASYPKHQITMQKQPFKRNSPNIKTLSEV